ncbi:MAG: hypothetical protein IT233_05805 [Bacteroidia bacterium]|nr:hypothetical protein [Bacteroidia bacterium]
MSRSKENNGKTSFISRLGLFLIVCFSLLIIPGVIFYDQLELEWMRALLMITTSVFIPLGFAFLFIKADSPRLNKVKSLYRLISFALLIAGLIMKYFHLPGSNMAIVIGGLWYCFAFGPLGLIATYRKWKPFANSWHDTTLLSIANFLGVNLLFLGALFKFMHWPYAIHILVPGGLCTLMSLWGWNHKLSREIILRKEAEEKLRERNKEVTDSIHYARRIQLNLLPQERYLEKVLKRLKNPGS